MMTDCTNDVVKCRKGSRKANSLHLDPDTEQQLREIVNGQFWAAWQTRRVEVILEMAKGAGVMDIIDRLGVSRSSIQRLCRTFEREGVAGLITRQIRNGRPRLQQCPSACSYSS